MRKHAEVRSVEVLFVDGCPNRERAADAVREVARDLGVAVEVAEVEVRNADDARRLRFFGSPSVRVAGLDVEPAARDCAAHGLACRTYEGGFGVPPRELLVAALGEGRRGTAPNPRGSLVSVLGAGALLLPVGTCPACLPAYAAALGSLGLGFLLDEQYLLPVTALVLGISLAGLAWRASTRRGYGPLFLGLAGSILALVGKFGVASDAFLYGGLAILIASSVWNAWPRDAAAPSSCARCARQDQGIDHRAHTEEVVP